MTNINKEVQRIIERDAAIRKDLARGIINKRALAAYVQKNFRIGGDINAAISAIRRYEAGAKEEFFTKATGIIRNAKISTRTNIAIIALAKTPDVQRMLPKIFSSVNYDRGEVIRIIQAEARIKVIVDEKNVPKVTGMVGEKDVLNVKKSLAELNMLLTETSAKVPGVLALLDTELAGNKINIVETCSCVPEVLWFFDQKDLLKAHQTFLELIESLK